MTCERRDCSEESTNEPSSPSATFLKDAASNGSTFARPPPSAHASRPSGESSSASMFCGGRSEVGDGESLVAAIGSYSFVCSSTRPSGPAANCTAGRPDRRDEGRDEKPWLPCALPTEDVRRIERVDERAEVCGDCTLPVS